MKSVIKVVLFSMFILIVNVCYGNDLFKGDFRFRYQKEQNTGSVDRDRLRIRLRIGSSMRIDDIWSVGFGLATGSDDPRSTNETMDNSSETPDIRLDYAYGEYKGIDNVVLWLGKYIGMKKGTMCFSDLLWDSDIRQEGLGMRFKKGYLLFNSGLLVIDENKSGNDPMMIYFQPAINFNFADNFNVKLFGMYYNSLFVQGYILEHSSGTNTTDTAGLLEYDYDIISSGMEFVMKDIFLPYFAVFGEFVYNLQVNSNNIGYLGGIKIGNAQIKSFGSWQLKYMYRYLERDAWLDIFPDSDALSGKTGIKGHEVEVKLGLSKHVYMGVDVYYSEDMISDNTQKLIQSDMVWKF